MKVNSPEMELFLSEQDWINGRSAMVESVNGNPLDCFLLSAFYYCGGKRKTNKWLKSVTTLNKLFRRHCMKFHCCMFTLGKLS